MRIATRKSQLTAWSVFYCLCTGRVANIDPGDWLQFGFGTVSTNSRAAVKWNMVGKTQASPPDLLGRMIEPLANEGKKE